MAEVDTQAPVDSLTSFDDVVDKSAVAAPQEDLGPIYRVYPASKIPVSKKRGSLWKSRRDQADSAMEKNKRAWQEAIRYYHNDHTRDNTGYDGNGDASNASAGGMFNAKETENIVFANVSALVPMLYTKNPDAEFTAQSDDTKPLAEDLEKLMKKIAGQKNSPGINLKRKMKRGIVLTTLCNCAWFEVGYTKREASSDQALMDLQKLSEQLASAKSQKEIREVEGALLALESKVDLLAPSGPWVKLRKPWEVFVDTAGTELDLSDSTWAIVKDMMPTSLLQALYGQKNPDTGEWESVYEPTHILKSTTGNSDDGDNLQKDGFVLFSKEGGKEQYGYKDDASFKAAQLTCVYYVWDKATRRCELYADNDWKFPVWVWDDPYRLDQFFPLVPLEFHTDPVKMHAKGEVTYYLDQQDALNLINNEFARMRAYATSLVGVNKNVITDPNLLEQILSGTYNKRTVPFDLPEGMKLSDAIQPVLPASAQAIQLFDKRAILETIDRVSGVTSVQRGVEYKTNTTNRAIESYESQQQTRADEKMDAIEECVGSILWLIAQMCLQFMDKAEVEKLIGPTKGWQNIDPKDIPIMFTPRVVGGSSLKPTSAAKKQQALQMSQIIGQFAKATPVALLIAIKTLQSAFSNELVMEDDDWTMLQQGIMQAMQAQQQQGQQGGQPPAQSGQPPQQDGAQPPQGGGGQQDVANVITQAIGEAVQIIDRLPPEIKQQIGVMLARQMPMQQIAQVIISKLDQQG